MSLACLPSAHSQRAQRGQGGFALMAGLFVVIMFAGAAMLALTMMTISSSKISDAQKLSTREVRAADNALESAVNLIRQDPTAQLGDFQDCLGPDPVPLNTNDRSVTVTATCEESDVVMPVGNGLAAPGVYLVGAEGYAPPAGDAFPWRTDCLTPSFLTTGCFPWALNVGTANFGGGSGVESALTGYVPNLVHSGGVRKDGNTSSQQLKFASNVLVKNGAAVSIDPRIGDAAVSVAGAYEQGSKGILGTNELTCGVSMLGHPWNALGLRIQDADDDDGLPTCDDGALDAKALNPRAELNGTEKPDGTGGRPTWHSEFTAFAAVPSTCPATGSVVELSAPTGQSVAAFGKRQTQQLNSLWDGHCPSVTYWFKPGNYWFDVDDPTQDERDHWNTLTIDDPTVRIIFGSPSGSGGAAAATFPRACDPGKAGVEIMLSPRTSIRHLAGLVAICDREATEITDGTPPAIWQASRGHAGWSGKPDPDASSLVTSINTTRRQKCILWGLICWWVGSTGTATVETPADHPDAAWFKDGHFAEARWKCNGDNGEGCTYDMTLTAAGLGNAVADPDPGPVESLDLIVKADWRRNLEDWALYDKYTLETTIKLILNDGRECGLMYPFAPDRFSMAASLPFFQVYDLMQTPGVDNARAFAGVQSCQSLASNLDRTLLKDATIELKMTSTWSPAVWSNTELATYRIDSIELRSGWDARPGVILSYDGGKWKNTESTGSAISGPFVSPFDGKGTMFSLHCGENLLGELGAENCLPGTATLSLGSLDNERYPNVPLDGNLVEAGVVISGTTSLKYFDTPGVLFSEDGEPTVDKRSTIVATLSNLRDTPGGTCSVTASSPKYKPPMFWQSIYLDLLDSSIAGTCPQVLTNAEQLVGATLDLTVYLDRDNRKYWCKDNSILAPDCASYSVSIDGAMVSTVSTGEYTRPHTANIVTVDADNGAMFTVYGRISTPRNELNINWQGKIPRDADGDPVPIGGGDMVLRGLGSYVGPDGEAGTVCCSPTRSAERIVNLVATVNRNGVLREGGRARIRVRDTGGAGAGLIVEDWELK